VVKNKALIKNLSTTKYKFVLKIKISIQNFDHQSTFRWKKIFFFKNRISLIPFYYIKIVYVCIKYHLGSTGWATKHWATPTADHEGFDIAQCVQPMGGDYEAACCANPISGLVTLFNTHQKCCDEQGLVHDLGGCSVVYRR